jgi:putative DNA methylase
MANNDKRLIEVAFPLKQASLDSVHEKNVRHGHISTLHIWPARRPLAASRAALIATLLPDPASKEERDQILEKLGGKIVEVVKKKKLPSGKVDEQVVSERVGGRHTADGPPKFLIRLRAVERSPWRLCDWGAR